MPINSFDTNYQETPCKFTIKATGEKIDGYRMDWHDGVVQYMTESVVVYEQDDVKEIEISKITQEENEILNKAVNAFDNADNMQEAINNAFDQIPDGVFNKNNNLIK